MIHHKHGVQCQRRISMENMSYNPERLLLIVDKRHENLRNTLKEMQAKGNGKHLVGNWEKMN